MAAKTPSVVQINGANNETIRFGMVAIDCSISPAFDDGDSDRPHGNLICPDHRVPTKQALYCTKSEHRVNERIIGYKVDGEYVIVPTDQMKAVEMVTDQSIDLIGHVEQIDPMIFERPYFIYPKKGDTNLKSFKMLSNVLEERGGYMLGTTIRSGTQKMVALTYHSLHDVVIMYLCQYVGHMRRPNLAAIKEALSEVEEPSEEEMALALAIFDNLPDNPDITEVKDVLGERQWEVVNAHAEGKSVEVQDTGEKVESVPDLLAALKASIPAKPVKKPAAKRNRRKAAA